MQSSSLNVIIRPKRKRPMPASGIVETRGQVGIHSCLLISRRQTLGAMEMVWTPGRPKDSMFIPEIQTKFRELQMKHAQKLADITQRSITFAERL